MIIKLCGIRRIEDIEYVNEFLPNYVGFVMADSKRKVTLDQLIFLKENLYPKIKAVGVFVNEKIENIKKVAPYLDVIQLHGDEDSDYINILNNEIKDKEIWKAVRVTNASSIKNAEMLPCDKLLFDSFSKNAYGGTGDIANWGIIKESTITKPFFLAGGLNLSNIENAINEVSPFGIDISSGIETDGVKDRKKIENIINLLRGVI